jgi:hypothetical protein
MDMALFGRSHRELIQFNSSKCNCRQHEKGRLGYRFVRYLREFGSLRWFLERAGNLANTAVTFGTKFGDQLLCSSNCANDPFASRAYVHDDVERGEFLDSMQRRCNG